MVRWAQMGKVAQLAHRVKDRRLRRAFGILDTTRRLCSGMVKGCCQPLSNRVDLAEFGWAAER